MKDFEASRGFRGITGALVSLAFIDILVYLTTDLTKMVCYDLPHLSYLMQLLSGNHIIIFLKLVP